MGLFWTRSSGEFGEYRITGGCWLQECQWSYERGIYNLCNLLCQSDELKTKDPFVSVSDNKEKSRNLCI